ncbi:MAG TPA: hypothetical protein DCP53_06890 [Elusimicrobia bacterium]|nr:MAG: hypothetical protein A2551_01680 [Elusimicrobia bacterium RIFOXYD2_FULL_34_30]HAM39100.1 hypothetical protein [Elusimicrobiota bacterium]
MGREDSALWNPETKDTTFILHSPTLPPSAKPSADGAEADQKRTKNEGFQPVELHIRVFLFAEIIVLIFVFLIKRLGLLIYWNYPSSYLVLSEGNFFKNIKKWVEFFFGILYNV